jgi:hypothetical protein
MKKSIFVAIAFIAATSITTQLFAQDSASKTSGYDVKKAVKCRVSQTDSGCTIVFESSAPSSDTSSGTALSKKGYDYYQAQSSFSVSALDNSVTEVTSLRDAASGQATGKRMHKPMTVSKEYDKSSPKLAESASSTGTSSDETVAKGSGGGSGKVNVQDLSMTKVNVQDISFTKRCGGKTTKLSVVDGECVIPTDSCPDGACTITADWSWGASQGGSSKRCSVDFLLEITDGVCHAINTKGTGGTRSGK